MRLFGLNIHTDHQIDRILGDIVMAPTPPRTLPMQMPAPLDPEEKLRALQSLRDEDPRWRVINQILAEEIAQAVEKSASPKAAADYGTSAHTSGAVMALLDFRDRLIIERAQALRLDEAGKRGKAGN
jgi:hypothetical protein